MSSPKIEDGYTRIANELLEAIIRFNFSKREMKIMLVTIRKTYGYQKKRDIISLSQFSNLTGIDKANVQKTLNALASKKVLLKQPTPKGQNVGINKNYGEWLGRSKQPIGQNVETIGQNNLPKYRSKQQP